MSGDTPEEAGFNGFLGSEGVLFNKPIHQQQLAMALYEALD